MKKLIQDKLSMWIFGRTVAEIKKSEEYSKAIIFHARSECGAMEWLRILRKFKDNPKPWKIK